MSNCVVASGGFGLPGDVVAQHSVEGCDHLAHDGDDDDFGLWQRGPLRRAPSRRRCRWSDFLASRPLQKRAVEFSSTSSAGLPRPALSRIAMSPSIIDGPTTTTIDCRLWPRSLCNAK